MITAAFDELKKWGALVKFSHTVFALPFALSILVIIARRQGTTLLEVLCLIGALVAARTAAMGFNRLVDAKIDASNPRTAGREIPRGIVTKSKAQIMVLIAGVAFLIFSWALGLHCLVLAPLVLLLLFIYSYTKRFTVMSHVILGLCLACAPGGVWYALVGHLSWTPVPLMLGVLLWVGGFDILYACQDADFDNEQGLYSIPSKLGLPRAFAVARIFHVASCLSLLYFGISSQLGLVYFIGLGAFALIVASQHLIVSPTNLSRIDAAFFTRNGIASIVFFLGVFLDQMARS